MTRRINAEMKGLNSSSSNTDPSICIETWVIQENFSQANNLLHDIAQAMKNESPGFKGMMVVTPSKW